MERVHPKTVRRRILTLLYRRYIEDPMDMLTPDDLLADGAIKRDDLAVNIHYLRDRGLVELMLGYESPLFNSARITADGIDLVENRFEFNLRFPPTLDEVEHELDEVPLLLEHLVAEVDFSPLDGEERRCLLRDVQYLRDEVARPADRWRMEVVLSVLDWLAAPFAHPEEALPSLPRLREIMLRRQYESRHSPPPHTRW